MSSEDNNNDSEVIARKTANLSQSGQYTVPKAWRDEIGTVDGLEAVLIEEDGEYRIELLPKAFVDSHELAADA